MRFRRNGGRPRLPSSIPYSVASLPRKYSPLLYCRDIWYYPLRLLLGGKHVPMLFCYLRGERLYRLAHLCYIRQQCTAASE